MNRTNPTSAPLLISVAAKADPLIDTQPSVREVRDAIRVYVHRLEVLRSMLRVSLKRERLGLMPPTARRETALKAVRA